MKPLSYTEQIWRWLVAIIDICILDLFYFGISLTGIIPQVFMWPVVLDFCYLFTILVLPPVAHSRLARAEQVASRSFWTSIMLLVVFITVIYLFRLLDTDLQPAWYMFPIFWAIMAASIALSRFLTRGLIKRCRSLGANNRKVIFVGAGHNLKYLYEEITRDFGTGYRVLGYFENHDENQFTGVLPKLGNLNQLLPYLEKQHVDMLFCNLTSNHNEEILNIMNYCENHLIRFYSVPNVRNYVHHVMSVEMVGTMPVMTLREEPLQNPWNKLIKRLFDIVFSGVFLITLFPIIFIVCALGIKLSSPGPIFFRQTRTGIRGKDFQCIKFRSMHVNAEADTLQATKHDPRKFRFGDFMRRTNLDEMPQFINVFFGDMSVVGPRPHMLKHTEEYSKLVNNYMVRHWAKPGITGWAQVTGSRGETEHLWQMEERIQKDVWYIENYAFMLDIKIIFMTIFNTLGHKDTNAY